MREVDAIDYFFVDKLKEYVKNFLDIQSQYLGVKMDRSKKTLVNPISGEKMENAPKNISDMRQKKLSIMAGLNSSPDPSPVETIDENSPSPPINGQRSYLVTMESTY